MTDSNLWILFFSLFVVLLAVVLYTLLRTCLAFMHRYCSCVKFGKCCCLFKVDWDGYRRERESLRRLRELRQQHREFLHLDLQLSTFSQIRGPIPDSVHTIRSGRDFGFIIVPSNIPNDSESSRPIRDRLTAEQWRRVLERIIACRPCSARDIKPTTTTDAEANDGNDISPFLSAEQTTRQEDLLLVETESTGKENVPELANSLVIPSHEEPADGSTCAICLDPLQEGELINDSMECPHVFHKDCLFGWLDKHNVCPCCRRCMVTEGDIKAGMREEGIVLEQGEAPISRRNQDI